MDKDNITADVLDIFSSIQGEGPFMGTKQIFVRFARCNMNCAFCDEKYAYQPSAGTPLASKRKEFSVDKMLSIIKEIRSNNGNHHSVSLTGGEPLLYKEYLKLLLPELRESGFKIYLDTNATLPGCLSEIIDLIDIIAADFKLPSSTGERPWWDEHREFINIARSKNCFIKVVVTDRTTAEDIEKAVEIARGVDDKIPLILQPAWPVKGIGTADKKRLFEYLFMAEKKLESVRILPQMHKILGVK